MIGNTKIGPVLDVKVCFHDRISVSRQNGVWCSNCERINKYVTETSETIALEIFEHQEVTVKPVAFEHKEVTGKPVAKAKPQLKSPMTLSPLSVPIRQRK